MISKDYSILGSILGSPYFGKLPYLIMIPGIQVYGVMQILVHEAVHRV